MTENRSPPPGPTTARKTADDERRRIASSDLLGDAGRLVIVHHGREYLLRVTQNGKLILTA